MNSIYNRAQSSNEFIAGSLLPRLRQFRSRLVVSEPKETLQPAPSIASPPPGNFEYGMDLTANQREALLGELEREIEIISSFFFPEDGARSATAAGAKY